MLHCKNGCAHPTHHLDKRFDRINVYELIFMVLALAFALGEYAASKEHGWESRLQFIHLTSLKLTRTTHPVYMANVGQTPYEDKVPV